MLVGAAVGGTSKIW